MGWERAGKAWLGSGPAAEQGWRSEKAPGCAGGGTSVMLAWQSCTNSHEAGCEAGDGARVQGWLGPPETEPGNHSEQGAPDQGQDNQPGISLSLSSPDPPCRPEQLRKACSDLSVRLCAARLCAPLPQPGHSLRWKALMPASFPGFP